MMSNEKKSGSTGSMLRLAILLTVLVIVGIALGYEFAIARPSFRNAIKTIERLQSQQLSAPRVAGKKSWMTEEDVHEALGRQPDEIDRQEHYLVETYRWRAGKLYTTYDLYVLYKMRNGEPTLENFQENDPFPADRLPKGPIDVPGIGNDAPPTTAGDSDPPPANNGGTDDAN